MIINPWIGVSTMLDGFKDEVKRAFVRFGSDLRGLADADIDEELDTIGADLYARAMDWAEKEGRLSRTSQHDDLVSDHTQN